MPLVHYSVTRGVAVLTIDNPPVNALGAGVTQAIVDAVDRAAADRDVQAIVIIGAGATFVAGADIRVFQTLRTREDALERSRLTHARFKQIEDSAKTVVAAIHGTALGGGLELAMACHYRVASPSARVGLPEVQLGIIPGAGGTQRVPRVAGAAFALELVTSGQHVSASRAVSVGIIDRILSGDLLEQSIVYALEMRGVTRKTRDQRAKIANRTSALAACDTMRAGLAKTARGAHAPYAAVDAVEAAITRDFDAGSVREMEIFADCVTSPDSRAMVHLFFAERDVARIPDVPKDLPADEIRRAAVVGAGTMGGGIAMSYANAGIPVLLKDTTQEALDRGLATIRKNYQASVSRGRMTAEQLERTYALIKPTLTYDEFSSADIVVEAAFEDMALKERLFTEVARVTRSRCILASNTSTLDIDRFAQASGRGDRVIGHHFFSPANVMRLLEIVRGRETSRETIATSMKLAKRLGKVGVLVGNCFGFVANRMLAYYMREAYLLLEEGASVPQIDRALTDFGLPVGPFAMQDIAGIDVGARIRMHLKTQGKTRADGPQSEVPDVLYEMGRYGQKTGAGWYRYDAGSRTGRPDDMVERLAADAAIKRGIKRGAVRDDQIIARITTALANEGANVLEDRMALRAGDIDVIYCDGFGFPRHRGGPMYDADTIGLPVVLERIQEYRERFGDYWRPSPLIERLVTDGRGFYSE